MAGMTLPNDASVGFQPGPRLRTSRRLPPRGLEERDLARRRLGAEDDPGRRRPPADPADPRLLPNCPQNGRLSTYSLSFAAVLGERARTPSCFGANSDSQSRVVSAPTARSLYSSPTPGCRKPTWAVDAGGGRASGRACAGIAAEAVILQDEAESVIAGIRARESIGSWPPRRPAGAGGSSPCWDRLPKHCADPDRRAAASHHGRDLPPSRHGTDHRRWSLGLGVAVGGDRSPGRCRWMGSVHRRVGWTRCSGLSAQADAADH